MRPSRKVLIHPLVNYEVSVMDIGTQPFFRAKDVYAALCLTWRGTPDLLRRGIKRNWFVEKADIDGKDHRRKTVFISRSAVIMLICQSYGKFQGLEGTVELLFKRIEEMISFSNKYPLLPIERIKERPKIEGLK